MRLLSRTTLQKFAAEHPNTLQALSNWRGIVENASWTCFEDVRRNFPTAESLGHKRVKFKIQGNEYRLIVEFRYADPEQALNGVAKVQFIGTHAEYDKIDAKTVTFRGA